MRLGPGTRVGPYEVLSLLGSGGMGEVYRVRDHRMARDVALKIMPAAAVSDDDRLWRFETEARTAGMLSHPNLLTIHDVGSFDGSPFLVSELLEGETLRESINRHAGALGGRGGGLPVTSVLTLARQIVSGLAAAHAAGVVHRDLKPDNVFVVRDGRVKILDFGLAKPQEPSATAQTSPMRTAPGTVLGTPGYMAPEQVRGDAVDARADLFSLGAILYELLAGRQAFEGPTAIEAMTRILRDEPPPLTGVPPLLYRTVLRCLEKQPERRFQSANDLLFVLEQAAESPSSGEYPPLMGRTLPRFRKITFRRGHIMSARFAPDGTIVYGAAWEGQSLEVFQARRGNPESRSLGLPAGDVLAVSAEGELALSLGRRYLAGFESSGTLARVQLPGGAPREILRSVQDCDWSPDGRRLAVIRRVGDLWRLEYPLGTVLLETPRWISAVRISPDDRALAFLEHRVLGDDAARAVIIDRNGKVVAQSDEWPSTGGLAWHPRTGEVWVAAEVQGGRDLVAFSPSGETRIVYNVPGAAHGARHLRRRQGATCVRGCAARNDRRVAFGEQRAESLLVRLVVSRRSFVRRPLPVVRGAHRAGRNVFDASARHGRRARGSPRRRARASRVAGWPLRDCRFALATASDHPRADGRGRGAQRDDGEFRVAAGVALAQ